MTEKGFLSAEDTLLILPFYFTSSEGDKHRVLFHEYLDDDEMEALAPILIAHQDGCVPQSSVGEYYYKKYNKWPFRAIGDDWAYGHDPYDFSVDVQRYVEEVPPNDWNTAAGK